MSISLTIYDLFANLVPGLIYLYVINEILIAFNQRAIDLSKLDQVGNLVLVGLAAYMCGHLANSITYRYWYKLLVRKSPDQDGLDTAVKRNPCFPLRFTAQDSRMLMSVIRHHTPDLARSIEMHQAGSIMMRNISLGAALFSVLQVFLAARSQQWGFYIGMAVLGAVATVMALNRAYKYDYWFHRDIFYEAVNYGTSLEDVLAVSQKLTAKEESAERLDQKPAAEKKKTGQHEHV